MIIEREVTRISLTEDSERNLIENIFEMAKSARPYNNDTDDEFLRVVGYIVKDLKDCEEVRLTDY